MNIVSEDENGPPVLVSKKAILLTNLGTPDAPTRLAVRRYLKEFLSDRRVVEIPRLIWWFILRLFILTFRAKSSAHRYKKIWTQKGSPLLYTTQQQGEKLQQQIDKIYGPEKVLVKVAMRYGNPSIAGAIAVLKKQQIEDITLLPLYPQYCAATVGSTFDSVSQSLKNYRHVPQLKFISGYHNNTAYIDAIVHSIKRHIAKHGQPQKLLLSFHGIPARTCQLGDPYFEFCTATVKLIQQQLQTENMTIIMTFQSRFGKAKWLQPYTDKTLISLAKAGVKKIAICCPGFAADCLETLEEIAVENRENFIQAGGEEYHYIPCLNVENDHIKMMLDILKPSLEN